MDNTAPLPMVVCQTSEKFEPRPGPGFLNIPLVVTTYRVLALSACLEEISEESRLVTARYDYRSEMLMNEFSGCAHRVRVIEIKRGPKKRASLLYYGKTRDLDWDPLQVQWP